MNLPDSVTFSVGDIVFRKTKPEVPLCVTGILFRQYGCVYYCTDGEGEEGSSWECELTKEQGFKINVDE